MIRRTYNADAIYGSYGGFERWKERARDARDAVCKAVQSGKRPEFNAAIWGALKQFQQSYFSDKCAYCEIKITPGFWGDVEHFRPKKMVEEAPDHPGYYWLAYEPENLLPSCQRCNQAGGKKNRFPVVSSRCYGPDEKTNEEPLLLNPYADSPFDHLRYDFREGNSTGYIYGITEKGRTSVNVYDLNREEMVADRRQAQRFAVLEYGEARSQGSVAQFISTLMEARQAYAAARIKAVEAHIAWQRAVLSADLEKISTGFNGS